jgi:hypothetical protein
VAKYTSKGERGVSILQTRDQKRRGEEEGEQTLSCSFTRAPLASSSVTMVVRLLEQATMRGVNPFCEQSTEGGGRDDRAREVHIGPA